MITCTEASRSSSRSAPVPVLLRTRQLFSPLRHEELPWQLRQLLGEVHGGAAAAGLRGGLVCRDRGWRKKPPPGLFPIRLGYPVSAPWAGCW